MAVGGEQNFDELLKRLSQVKSLPSSGQPFRTQQNIVGSQVRDAAAGAFRNTPSLSDAVSQITAGNQAPTGVKGALHSVLSSAPAKAILGGLTVIDTPRRAIISSIKEIGDALDSDPKTRASGGEWLSQVKDPTFGWGRVRPGKGWGGRIEGFVGDVLLDPLTYLTFGAAVPIKATAKGAASAASVLKAGRIVTAGADDVALRAALGTKTVAGREGRFALANAVRRYGGTADEVAEVASRGKSAVPDDIAKALGLNKSGLYMFGSRVRIPGSGRVGQYLEKGLVGTRLGIMNTRVGRKLSYLYTPRGTGFTGDLAKWRADVASGRLGKDKVNLIFTALNGAEEARALGSAARADELRRVVSMFDGDTEFAKYSQDLHKIIEQPDGLVLSPGQVAAKQKVEQYLDDVANRITEMMRTVEPGWTFQKITDKYVPHILTDKARRVIESRLDEPWAQRLEQYLAVDVLDMKGNMQSRRIKAGLEDFLASGKTLEDGSIDGINKMFREVTGENFDLFETDMRLILGGYADTVRGAAETAALMRNLMDDDFVRVLQQSGHVDEAYIAALKQMADEKWDVVAKNVEKGKTAARKARKDLRSLLGGSTTDRLLAKEKALLGAVEGLDTRIAQATKAADMLVPLLEELDTVNLAAVAAIEEVSRLSVGGNAATAIVKEQARKVQDNVNNLRSQLEVLRTDLDQRRLGDVVAKWPHGDKGLIESLDDELRQIDDMLESNRALLDVLQQYGDSFGPELQRIFSAFETEVFDDVVVQSRRGLPTETVNIGRRLSASQTQGFKSTDDQFNRVIQTVANPFSTDYLAAPTGTTKKGVEGISDPWVQSVVATEGTPEYELLSSIPDLGTRAGRAERVSMGSLRENARSLTLADARQIVVRASVTGDNPEEIADAFYFLTLRELRAAGLNAGSDEATRKIAQAEYARELMAGTTERARAWQTARKAVEQAAEQKKQFDLLASERTQLGTIKFEGRTIDLSEEGQSLIGGLQRAVVDAETLPADNSLRDSYLGIVRSLDSIIGSGTGTVEDVARLSSEIRQFLDFATIGPARDVALRNRNALDEFLGQMVDGQLNVNVAAAGSVRNVLDAFVREHLTSPELILRAQTSLKAALDNPSIAQASKVSQRATLTEAALAKSLREVGDILINYSVYHNARIAVDHVQRLVPKGVQVSDSLLRFAFAGSARQHAEYVKTYLQNRNFVNNLFRKIEDEMTAIPISNRAGWLQQQLSDLSETEFESIIKIMGDLTLVARKVPRDLSTFRPNQQVWQNVVKRILDLDEPGWDNPLTAAVAAEVTPEARVAGRAGVETGAGRRPALLDTKDTGEPADKQYREMLGAFKVQDVRANEISTLRKSSGVALRQRIDKMERSGRISLVEAKTLRAAVENAEVATKAAWDDFKVRLKKDTGFAPAKLNKYRRSLKNAPSDTYGFAALWAAATKTRTDGSTYSARAIDDFFAHLFGGRDVLVMRGSTGATTGPGESMTLDFIEGQPARLAEFEAPRAKRGAPTGGRADERTAAQRRIDDVFSEAKKVRKIRTERLAYIATQLGVDEDATIRQIIRNVVDLDDAVRVARVKGDEEFLEVAKLRNTALEKEFREAVEFFFGGVTRGQRSDDIYRHISIKDAHLEKIKDTLTRKIAGLQELVFSPEVGLTNIDSLRFGVDDLDTGKLALYRVRYLSGLAEDYRRALEAVEKRKSDLAKVRPAKARGAQTADDFDLFVDAYGGDPQRFGQLVRWVEATEEAIKAGDDLPPKPFGIKVPPRVEKDLRELRRARQAVQDLTQTLEYPAAREAHSFNMFLRELTKLNLDPQYYDQVNSAGYRYNIAAESRLRAELSRLAGGLGMDAKGNLPSMAVNKAEEVLFDDVLVNRFLKGEGSLDDIDILVRVDYGVDEVADKRAVVDFVRSRKGQKFEYEVSREQLRVGDSIEEVVVYTDLTGPIGTRTKYVYRLNDVSGDPRNLGGLEQGVPRLIVDTPIYAAFSQNRVYPVAGNVGLDRHYAAMARGNPVSAIKYTDLLDDLQPRNILVSGDGANRAVSADGLSSDDFHHLIDLDKTYVTFNVPSQKRRIVQRLSDANLPPQETVSLRPSEIFMGEGRVIDNARLAAAFAREQGADLPRTERLFSRLNKLRAERNKLTSELDAARFNTKERQRILGEREPIEAEIASLEAQLNAGLPEARNAARAVAWSLWERFKQPDTVGFLLGKQVDAQEAEEFALQAFKKYVKRLHDFKITKTLDNGEVVEVNPFVVDAGIAERSRANLLEGWNDGPESKVIGRYNELNERINAAVTDLNVIKNGGEAADLAARYISAMEQLRIAQRSLANTQDNVARQMYVDVDRVSAEVARGKVDSSRKGVAQAREQVRQSERRLREAQQVFVPERAFRDAETRLNSALRQNEKAIQGGKPPRFSPEELQALRVVMDSRSEQLAAAQSAKDAAIASAQRKVDSARAALGAREVEFSEANAALSAALSSEKERFGQFAERMENMTADEFDDFVKKEIDKIKSGNVSTLSVEVSREQLAATAATVDALSARRKEIVEVLKPSLQARYAGTQKLLKEAEGRHSALAEQLQKAEATLARIEASESRGGALPFGGKGYPPEYVAAKNEQQAVLKQLRDAQKRLDDLTKQNVKLTAEANASYAAGMEVNTLMLERNAAQGRLSLLQNALEVMGREDGGRPKWVKGVLAKDWDAEFDDVRNEIEAVRRALDALPPDVVGKDVDRVWASWTKYLEARASILLSKDDWEQAVQLERLGAAGVLNSDNMIWAEIPDDGFVALQGAGTAAGFSKLQMRPEVAEILGNMGRIRDGAFARQVRRWMIPYTRFFKAWALATPGFHVRNSITNGFMMLAAGGRPDFLYEAMLEYNALHKFLRKGNTFSQYLDSISDPTRRQRVSAAYDAMMGSGVGQSEEIMFDSSSVITNNPITRTSRRAGVWVESHSRFMLAYDGIRQGFDVPSATARVRRFLFDYEDVSKLDANMRQIIPFWTWTSRNVPLTIINVWQNPRPYQIYQSFKRNAQDNERQENLPLYMREAGAFALPGTNLAATPELGFNRLQADISMLSDPLRVAANMNPAVRVPLETVLANRSFFRNREFQQQPLPVSGPVGTLASLLGQPAGLGTSQQGQRYVDEKLLYALTNLVPSLNQVERFIPSQEYYQQRGSTNPLLGMLGAPVREITPEMVTSEQRRRLAEIQKLLRSQPQPEGQ